MVEDLKAKIEEKKEKLEHYEKPEEKEKEEERLRTKKEALELAQRFTREVVKRFRKIVKSVVIFGSFARGDFTKKSDVDLLVIYDDVAAKFTPELKEAFDEKLQEIAKSISPRLSVQPAWSLSEFWDMARIGHPLLYTIVRDGWALYDTGFFIPVRKLLEAGKIPHTIEAVELLMHSAPKKIERVESVKLYAVAEDLYYAMLNSSQALLMFLGKNAPIPKEIVRAVREYLVDEGLLPERYLKWLEEVVKFRKDVEHKRVKRITGKQLDEYISKAKLYVRRMEQLLERARREKKTKQIIRNYEVMVKAAIAALKAMDKLPPDPKDLPKAIREHLIKEAGVNPFYEEVLREVATMRKLVDEKRVNEIPERDVELMREYVRRFVREMAELVEKLKK